MSIVDLDAGTGLPLSQITAQPSAGANGPLYCYPEAPQMAIRGDGAVIIAALGSYFRIARESWWWMDQQARS